MNINALFNKEPLFKEPTCRGSKYLRNLYYEKKAKNRSILKLFVTANNQELGSQLHSFTAKTRIE